ncbi:MAG: hypothetical protein AB7F86_01265 [Bdellovibrionales bacterium]
MNSSTTETSKPNDRRIDRHYIWRKPTIVDRHPDFLAYLDTKPKYIDALYERRHRLRQLEWNRITTENSAGKPPRKLIDMDNLKVTARLTLVTRSE